MVYASLFIVTNLYESSAQSQQPSPQGELQLGGAGAPSLHFRFHGATSKSSVVDVLDCLEFASREIFV